MLVFAANIFSVQRFVYLVLTLLVLLRYEGGTGYRELSETKIMQISIH